MAHREHEEDEGTFGVALGFRTVEDEGQIFIVEAEIAPYLDAPNELGATLVFHPIEGLDPTAESEELDWPTWPVDIDDDLERNPAAPVPEQFKAIVRQLHNMTAEQLAEYLRLAREGADEEA